MLKRDIAYGDLFASLGLIALSAYILKESTGWVVYGSEGPGPGFFPIMYGLLMLGLSLYLFQRSLRKGERASGKEPGEREGVVRALATWVGLAICVPLMIVLGFVIGFGIFAFFVIRFVFGRSYRASLVTAVCIVIALHLVFPVMLDAPLPTGMFWGF